MDEVLVVSEAPPREDFATLEAIVVRLEEEALLAGESTEFAAIEPAVRSDRFRAAENVTDWRRAGDPGLSGYPRKAAKNGTMNKARNVATPTLTSPRYGEIARHRWRGSPCESAQSAAISRGRRVTRNERTKAVR